MVKKIDFYKFYQIKKVLVTGHTGFKGSWLCLILWLFGAKVIGVSSYDLGLKSNYKILRVSSKIHKEYRVDINNFQRIIDPLFDLSFS